jgi:putative ABC transport system permease protein
MKYARLVLKSLMRSKRRTVLTVLSIAVSLFIFSALISLPTVADQFLADSASTTRIACHNKAGVTYELPEAYTQRIAATPHVVAVTAQSWFGGIYHEVSDQFPNIAVDPEQIGEMWQDWDIAPQSLREFQHLRTGALVGTETMQRFRFHVGQQIMLRGTIYPFNVTVKIVGTLGGKAPPSFLLFRRDYLEEARGRPGYVDVIWVKVDNSANVSPVIAALDEGFANSSAETLTEPEAAFYGGFIAGYRVFFKLAELMGIVVVFTIGLVAANTAAMSIRERRTEIAVLRSIGFSLPHCSVDASGRIPDYCILWRVTGMRRCLPTAEDDHGSRSDRSYPNAGGGTLGVACSCGATRHLERNRASGECRPTQYCRYSARGRVRWRYRSSTICAACSCGGFPVR